MVQWGFNYDFSLFKFQSTECKQEVHELVPKKPTNVKQSTFKKRNYFLLYLRGLIEPVTVH